MKYKKTFLALLIYFLETIFLEAISISIINANDSIIFYTIINILKYLIIIFTLFLVFKEEPIIMLKDYKTNHFKYFKKTFLIYFLCLIIMMTANYFINKSYPLPNNELLVRNQINNYLVYSIISIVFLIPIIEEIVFRLSFNVINNKYLYLIITSLIFASLHITNGELLYLIPYFFLSLSFACAYQKTNNIFSSITIHMIHNLFVLIMVII